ncbi:hypothetical protein RDWZM_005026 [Blomia tropicalis]|uniref:Uncharacterized protein n=1 Tax=Blomia tropicalis TaxID=40697 RepID=A0A9Q0M599_BLOTA|nr:hypothetical protein RDWZM_005026 [Blomia tropicalis]
MSKPIRLPQRNRFQSTNGTPQSSSSVRRADVNAVATTATFTTKAPGNYYGTIKNDKSRGETSQKSPNPNTNETTLVRQHQQNVEIVDVPEARKFFIYNIATRQEILGKLNLNSLIEYIEHLEAYRLKNREKIEQFNEFYYPVIKGEKMKDPDLEEEPEPYVDPVAKLTQDVKEMLTNIEQKLEACQLKRMMNNDIESIYQNANGVIGNAAQEEVEVIDLTYNEKQNNESEIQNKESKFNETQVNNEEGENILDDDAESDREIIMDTNVQELKMESEPESDMNSEDSGSVDGKDSKEIRNVIIDELQNKLHELEVSAKQCAETTGFVDLNNSSSNHNIKQENDECSNVPVDLTSDLTNVQSNGSIDAKLTIGGYQLPLPKVFNRLSQVEKNLLMCKLPEMVRGQYLSMCWESRFYEHLAKAPLSVREKLLLNLNL